MGVKWKVFFHQDWLFSVVSVTIACIENVLLFIEDSGCKTVVRWRGGGLCKTLLFTSVRNITGSLFALLTVLLLVHDQTVNTASVLSMVGKRIWERE